MSISTITNEPRKGIRLRLQGYFPIRAWQGGGNLWNHDFQMALRQGALSDFLPRATDQGDAIFFEHVYKGVEVSSTSIPSGPQEKIPSEEVKRLAAALQELKARGENPRCDRDSKRMIESFRLPDPQKDPELYRLYSAGGKKRLLVLWGCEKEEGSALAPIEAIQKVRPDIVGSKDSPKSMWLVAVAAAAVLIIGLVYFGSKANNPSLNPVFTSDTPQNPSHVKSVSSVDPIVNSNHTPNNPLTVPPRSSDAAGASSLSPEVQAENPAQSEDKNKGGQNSVAEGKGPMPPGRGNVNAREPKQPNVTPVEVSSPNSLTATTNPNKQDHQESKMPPSPADKSAVSVGDTPNSSDKVGNNTKENSPASRPQQESNLVALSPQNASSPNYSTSDSGAKKVLPGEPLESGTAATVKKPITFPIVVGGTITNGQDVAKTSDNAFQSGAILRITKRDTSSAVKDGFVELTLDATIDHHEAAVTEWLVDNILQKTTRGEVVKTSSWTVPLRKGKHTVSVTASGQDGKPVNSMVEISVGVIEAATVELSPVNGR